MRGGGGGELELGGGGGYTVYQGVNTICGVVEEVIQAVEEFVKSVRWRFMGGL